MSSRKTKRFLLVIAFFGVLVIVARLSVDAVLRRILVREFAEGTQCQVQVGSVSVGLFPLRALARNISLRHPQESQVEGLSAEEVSVNSEYLPLFRGEVRLNNLRVEGVNASSRGENSAFFKTLDFLLPSETKPARTSAVSFKLSGLFLKSGKNRGLQISPPGSDTSVRFENISFSLEPGSTEAPGGEKFQADSESASVLQGVEVLSSLGRVRLRGEIGGGKIQFEDILLNGKGDEVSKIEGSGILETKGEGSYDLKLRGRLLESSLRHLIPKNGAGIPQEVHVRAQVGGELRTPKFSGALRLIHAEENFPFLHSDCRPRESEAEFELDANGIVLSKLRIDENVRNGEATYQFSAGVYRVNAPFSFQREWIENCLRFQAPRVGGEAELFQSLGGTIETEGSLKQDGNLIGISLDAPGILNSHIDLKVQTKESKLQIALNERLIEASPENRRLRLVAAYDTQSTALAFEEAHAVNFPLRVLLAVLTPFVTEKTHSQLSSVITPDSKLDAKLSGSGNIQANDFEARGELRLENLELLDEKIPEIRIPIRTPGESIHLSLIRFPIRKGTLEAEIALGKKSGALSGKVQLENVSAGNQTPLERVSVEFELLGSIFRPSLSLKGNIGGAATNPLLLFSGKATPDGMDARLHDSRGSATCELRLVGGFGPDGKLMLDGRLEEVDLAQFSQATESGFSGQASGQFHYETSLGRLPSGRGSAEFSRVILRSPGFSISHQGPIRLDTDNGVLRFSQMRLLVLEKPFTVSGSVSAEKGWNVDVDGEWSLAALPHQPEFLEQLAGTLNARVQARGEIFEPQFSGTLSAANVSFVLPVGDDVLSLRNGKLDGRFDRQSFVVDGFRASVGAGEVSGSAVMRNVLDSATRELEVHSSLRRIRLQPVENLRLALSGVLDFEKRGAESGKISGKLHIDRAAYEETIDLKQIVSRLANAITGAAGRRAAKASASSRNTEGPTLDLLIEAENDLIVETNVVRAELEANLRVTGSLNAPLVDGQIGVLEGDFGTEANQFQISTGRADFRSSKGSLDPDLYVIAETTVVAGGGEQQQVRMFLSGSITKPKVEFVSDGGLRQEEIIGLLGLRTNLQTVHLIQGEKENRSFVDLIDPTSGATLEDRLSGITGFSTVQVDTALSATTGEVVPRLVAERPVWDQLTLHAMAELSGQQLSILNLSYPLNLYLNLVAGFRTVPPTGSRVDSSGSFYIGLRHRSTFPGTTLFPRSFSRTNAAGINSADQNFGLPR